MKRLFQARYLPFTIFFVLIALYSLYQARSIILGPQVWITSHQNGEVVNTRLITLEGEAKDVAWLNLNGRQIFTDEAGHWSEKLLLGSGLSIMTVEARDRFGRETSKTIEIYFKQS